jgi:signal transduction histidine kinase
MPETEPSPSRSSTAPLAYPADSLTGITEWVVRIALMAVVVIYVAAAVLVFQWQQLPFLGAFVDPALTFSDIGSQGSPAWPAFAPDRVHPGDLLLAVNGQAVSTAADLPAELGKHAAGEAVGLELGRADGSRAPATVTLSRFADTGGYFFLPYFIGLVYLVVGLWIIRLRRREAAGLNFGLFCVMAAAAMGSFFDLYTTHVLAWAWALAVPLAGGALISLGCLFPQEWEVMRRWPGLRLLSYVPAVCIAAYELVALYAARDPLAYHAAWQVANLYLAAGALVFVAAVAYRWAFGASLAVRGQSQLVLIGSVLAFAAIAIWAGQAFLGGNPAFNPLLNFLPLAIFPLSVAYAIRRYRRLDVDRGIGLALVYVAVSGILLAAYVLVLWGVSQIASLALGASIQFRADNPAAVVALVVVLLLVFNPLRDRFQRMADFVLFRGSRAYGQLREQFSRELTRAATLDDIYRALDAPIQDVLRPSHFFLFLRDAAGEDFLAYAGSALGPASDWTGPRTEVRFSASGALAGTLAQQPGALYLTPDTPLPQSLQRERARLAALGSAIYAPLTIKSGLLGWLALGPKLSFEPYTREDIQFAVALGDQSALAVERATVISDLEHRVQELNVLSQLSQAVNFTSAYDDLLELIYAQTSRVVDTRHFFILLRDPRHQAFNCVFYVENNERVTGEENKLWAAGQGLESEVINTGRPLRTDDYVAECRRRDLTPGPKSFRAWLGVPLNAGAQTIGVVSLGAYEAESPFTDEQLKIFAAIADQAASALVKAQLLQQADQRARQLATLNEISTSMGSMLEFEPLLQRIVQSSVDMLACQAGSLFLIDEDTGEYIFKVAVGPVGHNLVGMRMAAGQGFVGEAIQSGLPLAVNDVQTDPRWFKGSDATTGFVTRALLVVPLRRAERAIGALEVINKADGSPFDAEDQSLLTAFSGPATIAIENARLFTQTDQALAARVDELSMMQRIDRELNATLDIRRVMSIALDWAMKNTGAIAGSIGSVTDAGLRIIATQGYGDKIEKPDDAPLLPLDRGIMGRVVRSGELNLVRNVKADPDYRGVLETTQCQLTLPLKHEAEVLGLLTLESPDANAFSDEQVAFVVRLMDHAAVALTNARLYAQVQLANVAKSEFVSFVVHELKTPMTSIKGYADLLAAGAVGVVSDMQKQFLGIVRSNVDRMTTLVNDLNDQAKIEAGKLRIDLDAVPFSTVVDDVVRSTRGMIEAKKQALRIDMEPDLPRVRADYGRAVQVLTNLVSNANKYTPEGGEIVVRAVQEPDAPDLPGPATRLHVSVRDNGIGIAPDDQKKLFQKFFRAEDRVAREMAPGTGLGLNIVKNLVELQGGRIWFDSEFRKGSVFHFTLPLAPEPAAEPEPAA